MLSVLWKTSTSVNGLFWTVLPHCSSFGRRGGPESEAGVVLPRPGLLVGVLDRPSGLSFRFFGLAQELRVVRNAACWAEPLLGSRSLRDPGFMNPTLALLDQSV